MYFPTLVHAASQAGTLVSFAFAGVCDYTTDYKYIVFGIMDTLTAKFRFCRIDYSLSLD